MVIFSADYSSSVTERDNVIINIADKDPLQILSLTYIKAD